MQLNKNNLLHFKIIGTLSALLLILFSLKAQNIQRTGLLQYSGKMEERWELGAENNKGLFNVTPYRPVYITAGRRSNNPNVQPTSENPAYTLPFKVPYNNY